MKRLVSIVLVLVLCLALLPTIAFADTKIENLTITMDLPDPGKDPITTGTCGKGYSIHDIEWLDRETDKFLEPGDKIQGGHKYYAYLWVEANSGYSFASIDDLTPNVNVTVNGAACTASKAFEYIASAMVRVRYSVTIPTKGWIRSVDLTIPAPKVGEKPSYPQIEHTTYKYTNMVDLPEYINGIHWVNAATDKNISANTTFQAGVQYQFNITIAQYAGYAFLPQPTATVNGKAASCNLDYGTVLFVKSTFPALENDHAHIYSDWDWNSGQHYKTCLVDGCDYDIFFVESHKGGTATCSAKGKCSVCGYAYLEKNENHSPDSKWTACGSLYHAKLCKLCGAHCDPQDHVEGPAGTPGAEVVCKDCGYIMEPAANHTHQLTKVSQTPATCTAEGNIEYYTCSGCNDLFTDAEGKNLIPETMSVAVGVLDHTPSAAWSADQQFHWRTCTVCKAVLEETKVAHDPDQATCTVCSTADVPDTTAPTEPAVTEPEVVKPVEEKGGIPWWVWVLVAAACAGAGICTAILLVKKKK